MIFFSFEKEISRPELAMHDSDKLPVLQGRASQRPAIFHCCRNILILKNNIVKETRANTITRQGTQGRGPHVWVARVALIVFRGFPTVVNFQFKTPPA